MTKGKLAPELLLTAYASGVFPMAESKQDASVFWVSPENRGVLPLDGFHVSRSMRRFLKKGVFDIAFDTAFREVMEACADRNETWINGQILDGYCRLFELGFAHSVETRRNGRLVGGLYGVSLGGAFFGESMFSKETNASKTALCALVNRLKEKGFTLLDTQFITPHLASMGAVEIPRDEYLERLKKAIYLKVIF